jgi:hypothetical protein
MSGDDETRTPWPRSWWEAAEDDEPTIAKKRGAPGRTNETAQLWPRHPSFVVRDIVTGAASNVDTLRTMIECLQLAIKARKWMLASEQAADVRSALAYQRAQLTHAHRRSEDEAPEYVARVRLALDQLAQLEAAAAPWLDLAPDAAIEATDRGAWLARVDHAAALTTATNRSRPGDRGRVIDAAARFRARAKARH